MLTFEDKFLIKTSGNITDSLPARRLLKEFVNKLKNNMKK